MSFRGLDFGGALDKYASTMQQGYRDRMELMQQGRLANAQALENDLQIRRAQQSGLLPAAPGSYGAPVPTRTNQGMQMPTESVPQIPQEPVSPTAFTGNRSPAGGPPQDDQATYDKMMQDKGWVSDGRGYFAPDHPQYQQVKDQAAYDQMMKARGWASDGRGYFAPGAPNNPQGQQQYDQMMKDRGWTSDGRGYFAPDNPNNPANKGAPPSGVSRNPAGFPSSTSEEGTKDYIDRYAEAHKKAMDKLQELFPGYDRSFYMARAEEAAKAQLSHESRIEEEKTAQANRVEVARVGAGSRERVANTRASAYLNATSQKVNANGKVASLTAGKNPTLDREYDTHMKLAQSFARQGNQMAAEEYAQKAQAVEQLAVNQGLSPSRDNSGTIAEQAPLKKLYSPKQNKTYYVDANNKPVKVVDGKQ